LSVGPALIRSHPALPQNISQFTDAMTRAILLDIEIPVTGNVIALC
jgi:hypothetical protein